MTLYSSVLASARVGRKWYTVRIMATREEQAYVAAYERLTPKQREAVDTIEGPVMVVAGPGTGKTQILTLRIANILRQTQMQPENILALTFTKSGARAMRERLERFVGATAHRVPIFTFHGLCEKLIREYGEQYTKIVGGKAATDIEVIEIIEGILETPELRLLRPSGAPQLYVKPIRDIISDMKQENVLPDDLARLIGEQEVTLNELPRYHEKGAHKGKERSEYTKLAASLEKQRSLLVAYRLYEATMRDRGRYDYNDMIVETVRVLKENESVRLDLQETYQYILADEHQDVNGAQNEILSLLTSYHDEPNLFVVGDEKQAIYRFQGASLENFLYFEKQYPSTKVIVLTDNFRSTQPILDASHGLIAVAEGPLADYRLPLHAHREAATTLILQSYSHEHYENEAVVAAVQQVLAEGIPPNEVAIIVRSNREVERFATLLSASGIQAEASADRDVLEHPLFFAVIDLLEVIVSPTNELALTRLLTAPYFGIPLSEALNLLSLRSYAEPLSSLLEKAVHENAGDEKNEVVNFWQCIHDARAKQLLLPPHRLLASVLTESGLMAMAVKQDELLASRLIRRLYDEVEALVINGEAKTLHDVVTVFRRRMEFGLPLVVPFVKDTTEAVQVLTAHKSKGLEFNTVFVPHVTDTAWSGKARPQLFKVPLTRTAELKLETNEDERRLLYVAMTRAKERLLLSFATTTTDGGGAAASPLLSAPSELIGLVVPEATQLKDMVIATPSTASLATLRPLLLRTLRDRGLSATALNNCLRNPWDYFYRNVIRLPEVQSLSMQFGTAMHGVLEFATKEKTRSGTMPSFTLLRTRLEQELGRLPLSTTEFSDLFAKGQEVLVAYIPILETNTINISTKEELSIRVSLPTQHPDLPLLTLTGKLDRIDLDTHGQAQAVVDYKTGKPKSRNEIEGKTATSDGGYRRQLAFYSLLLEHYDDDRYRTTKGVLSFIEPDSKGRIHEESFDSGPDERATLRQEIETAVHTIISGEFLLDEQLLAESEYAHFGRSLIAQLKQST